MNIGAISITAEFLRTKKRGTRTMGELISKQSDHRVPSTESLANLAGIGRSIIF